MPVIVVPEFVAFDMLGFVAEDEVIDDEDIVEDDDDNKLLLLVIVTGTTFVEVEAAVVVEVVLVCDTFWLRKANADGFGTFRTDAFCCRTVGLRILLISFSFGIEIRFAVLVETVRAIVVGNFSRFKAESDSIFRLASALDALVASLLSASLTLVFVILFPLLFVHVAVFWGNILVIASLVNLWIFAFEMVLDAVVFVVALLSLVVIMLLAVSVVDVFGIATTFLLWLLLDSVVVDFDLFKELSE